MDTEVDDDTRTHASFLTVPLSGITSPGVYITERGDMLRIASEFMASGKSSTPLRESLGRVTRISEDPCEAVSVCRRVAARNDLPFNF